MLRLIIRKMFNNKWMVACLIIGCAFAIAVASAIPMYSAGIYDNLLVNEFKNQQQRDNTFPFRMWYNATFFGLDNSSSKVNFDQLDNIFYDDYIKNMPLDTVFEYKNTTTKVYSVFDQQNYLLKQQAIEKGETLSYRNLNVKADYSITAAANGENMVVIEAGRIFEKSTEDDVIEAVITQRSAALFRLSVGDYYYLYNRPVDEQVAAKIKIVGIAKVSEEASSFFTLSDKTFLISFEKMEELISNSKITLQQANWFAAFDYTKISILDTDSILSASAVLKQDFQNSGLLLSSSNNYVELIKTYESNTLVMQRIFLLLIIPVILMIAMYVVMISQLMMEREKSEIATLESRGASRGQIFKIYFGQGIILSLISLVLGILLARGICRLLGASNGFMEFVNRTAIDAKFSMTSFIYALICCLIYMIMILIPAYKASKYSIVQHKQNIANGSKKSFWQVIFLDLILLAISIYFLYSYNEISDYLKNSEQSFIDFTLFIAVTLFVMGLGLLFIRLFPYLIKFIFFIGKRLWRPASYTAFTHVARGGNYKQFIMIFLILAISIGIFNANTGRTINDNIEDNIRYRIGADALVITGKEHFDPVTGTTRIIEDSGRELEIMADKICESEYVDNYCVIYQSNMELTQSQSQIPTEFIGINPYTFGKTTSLRNDLNGGFHLNYYLNLLSTYPQGVIISKKLADEYEVTQGDYFNYEYSAFSEQIFMENILVVGIVDYWPGIIGDSFIVLTEDSYITMKYISMRGKILLDKKDGYLDSILLEDLKTYLGHGEYIYSSAFTDYELTLEKKNSILNGMNGILTLDFLISMIICCVGFIIFWIISVRQRVLQFGIFRAMGMKKSELYRMIFFEQLMVSFVSVIMGIVIGGLTTQLFLPLIERLFKLGELVVPFTAYQDGIDYIRIYVITGLSLIVGLSVLLRFISKLKIDQALKLGED
ncbi:MAG: FtsX-like permease family protein [Clostridia bacterium]|nr:FtsX-like permease family protein [Clostridia bacterium]